MKAKSLIVLIGILAFGLSVKAQNLIRIVEDTTRTQTVSLKGNAQAVFVSTTNNLFIETSRPNLDEKKNAKKISSNRWEYVIDLKILTQEGAVPSRTFSITQTGSANKTTFKKGKFESNKRYYFNVETVENPVFLIDNSQETDVHLVKNEADIEINSLFPIEVLVDPKLQCKINQSQTKAGYYSTSIVVDMKKLNELRGNVEREQMLYYDRSETLLQRAENGEEVKDSEWVDLQMMQQHLEDVQAVLADVSLIRLAVQDSNELNIDISELVDKQKKVYTVEKVVGNVNKEKSHWMLLGNYGLSNSMQHTFGLTLAWVHRLGFGFYANAMTNANFTLSTDMTGSTEQQEEYFWMDQITSARASATLGGMFAIKKFGYVYAGAGYGIRNLVWYTEAGQSVEMNPGTYKGAIIEAGLMFNIGKHVEIQTGGEVQLPGSLYGMKLGLGYKF